MFKKVWDVLNKLSEYLEDTKIYDITPEQRERFKKYGEELPEPLPAIVGKYKDRQVNIDFVPWDEKRYVRILDVALRSKFEMFIEKKGGERKFQGIRTRIPLSEIKWGDEEFNDKYVSQACMLPLVQRFIEDKSTSQLIRKLGDFEKVTIDLRYIRVYHFLVIGENLNPRSVIKEMDILTKLSEKIESLNIK